MKASPPFCAVPSSALPISRARTSPSWTARPLPLESGRGCEPSRCGAKRSESVGRQRVRLYCTVQGRTRWCLICRLRSRIHELFCAVFCFFHVLCSRQDAHSPVQLHARTCVRSSNTSLKLMLVLASLLWSIMTTLLLCSSTCFARPCPDCDCWARTYACNDAISLLIFAMSCLIQCVSS
jgi:hypothetical protein